MNNTISDNLALYNNLIGEIDSLYHEANLKFGYPDSVMHIFYALCVNGNSCMLSDICRKTGLSKQTVNSAIRKMEKEELIVLESVNSKSKRVTLSEKGEELAKKTTLKLINIEASIFAEWSAEDLNKYIELTKLYLQKLKEKLSTLEVNES